MEKFFRDVLPSRGVYASALRLKNSTGDTYFKYFAYDSLDELITDLKLPRKADMFYAVCSFKQKNYNPETGNLKDFKTQVNSKALKSFYLDLDCGSGKEYQTQVEALSALKKFVNDTGFPTPYIVNSGNGIHVYWAFSEAIDKDTWLESAENLKILVKASGLRADPAVTADCSRILRVPGSLNYKSDPPTEVKILKVQEDILDPEDYIALIKSNLDAKNIPTVEADKPIETAEAGNVEPVDRDAVYEGCKQMHYSGIEKRGDVGEQLWHSTLQLERFLENPQFHEISAGHPEYHPSKTNEKVKRFIEGNIGPTLCKTFDAHNKGVCQACPHWNEIKSPISLGKGKGYKIPESAMHLEIPVIELVTTPKPTDDPLDLPVIELNQNVEELILESYEDVKKTLTTDPDYGKVNEIFTHSPQGVYMTEEEPHGATTHHVCRANVYPIGRMWNENEKVETILVRIKTPNDPPRVVSIRSGEVTDRRKLKEILGNAGATAKPGCDAYLETYMISYLQKIQEEGAAIKKYTQLGWNDDGQTFVLPDKVYYSDGRIEDNIAGSTMSSSSRWIKKSGKLSVWQSIAKIYGLKGYEAYLFGFMLAYASILFRFTDFQGALVNLLGDSGSGKSTVLKMINSVFGDPLQGMLSSRDTENGRIKRVSVMNSLAPTYDEITNMENNEVSDICYVISIGRDKIRLDRNGEERENHLFWRLIMVSSSNQSLNQKLALAKLDSKAESMRLMEYHIRTSGHKLTKAQSMEIFEPLKCNYGHAGEIFIEYVMSHLEEVEQITRQTILDFDKRSNMETPERYWSAIIGCVLAAIKITKKAGLHDFNYESVENWAITTISAMRETVADNNSTADITLSRFISEHIGQMLVVNPKDYIGANEPKNKLTMRYETKANRLYIDRAVVKRWISEEKGDYDTIKRDLSEMGILLNDKRRTTLAKGAKHVKSGQSICWVVDMSHDKMYGEMPSFKVIEEAIDLENDKIV